MLLDCCRMLLDALAVERLIAVAGYGGMARLGPQTRPKKFSIFPVFRDGDVNA
jgi:hypothetical protein